VRAPLPDATPTPLAERRDHVSKTTVPRHARGLGGYCWEKHPKKDVHCTEPVGHPPRDGKGGHWHTYSKTAW
jgi:hypothetical protein